MLTRRGIIVAGLGAAGALAAVATASLPLPAEATPVDEWGPGVQRAHDTKLFWITIYENRHFTPKQAAIGFTNGETKLQPEFIEDIKVCYDLSPLQLQQQLSQQHHLTIAGAPQPDGSWRMRLYRRI